MRSVGAFEPQVEPETDTPPLKVSIALRGGG